MSNKKDYTYKVKKSDKKDFKKSVIVRENVTVEFTLDQVEQHEKQLLTRLKELTAERDVAAAEIDNIAHFHPYVKKFDKQQLHAIGMYKASNEKLAQIEPLIKDIEAGLKEYKKERKAIFDQCGFEEPIKGMTVEHVKQERKPGEGGTNTRKKKDVDKKTNKKGTKGTK